MTTDDMQKILQEMAVNSGEQANKKNDEFSSLLIQIAFASVGLAAVYLETGERPYSSLVAAGVIFLTISIVSGGLQMILDYSFFRKHQKLLQQANHLFAKFQTESTPQNILQMNTVTQKMREIDEQSPAIPTYFQVAFILAGAGLILFAFLRAL